MTVYIQTQGATVQKRGETIIVKAADGDILEEIPLIQIQRIVLVGYVQISTQALDALFSLDIPICYLSLQGRFKGIAIGIPSKNSLLRLAQYRHAHNPERCLSIAKAIVHTKIHNKRVILMRTTRGKNGEGTPYNPQTIAGAADNLKGLMEKVKDANNLDTLLGIEGLASKEYFSVFQSMIKHENKGLFTFTFEGRNRRPPLDPVNALLSLAYGCATNLLVAI